MDPVSFILNTCTTHINASIHLMLGTLKCKSVCYYLYCIWCIYIGVGKGCEGTAAEGGRVKRVHSRGRREDDARDCPARHSWKTSPGPHYRERQVSSTLLYCTPQPPFILFRLSTHSHRNAQIRRTAAQFLSQIVEQYGPAQLLHASRDLLEKTLIAILGFIGDAAADPRYTNSVVQLLWL